MEGVTSKHEEAERIAKQARDDLDQGKSVPELLSTLSQLTDARDDFMDEWEKVFEQPLGKDSERELENLKAKTTSMIDSVSSEIVYKVNPGLEKFKVGITTEGKIAPLNEELTLPRKISIASESEVENTSTNPFLGAPYTRKTAKENEQRAKGEGSQANTEQPPIHDPSAATNQVHRSDLPVMQLKLDRLTLPMFDGQLTEWTSFRDQFNDMVHENPNLSSMLKFHQLRSHLRGAALDTVSGYKFSAQNYEAAWLDLNRRFDRTDAIIEEYIRKFMELPVLAAHPTGKAFTGMIDATTQMLRALPNWGILVRSWDPWIKFMMVTKLDDATRREWKQHTGRHQQVPLADLLDFLETKAMEVQPLQGDRLRQMFGGHSEKKGREKPRKILHAAVTKCPNCNDDHPLYKCQKLLALKAKDRTEVVKKLKLCFKCLNQHERDQCKKGGCPECNGPHNRVLCFKYEREHQSAKPDSNRINHVAEE